jgi:hypothetical protein
MGEKTTKEEIDKFLKERAERVKLIRWGIFEKNLTEIKDKFKRN